MDLMTINGIPQYIYDNIQEFNVLKPNEELKGNWRQGNEEDWVLTDDGFVLQILKKAETKTLPIKNWVRTVCGSYIIEQNSHRILGEKGIADDIYSFSGNCDSKKDYEQNRKRKSRESMFITYMATDIAKGKSADIIAAFKKAYPEAKNIQYIKRVSTTILKKESVQKMLKEEVVKILAEEGVSAKWAIGKYKDIVTLSERDGDRLRSLDSLSKMLGLFDTGTKKEQVAIWAGFTPEQIEGVTDVKGTKILAQKEKGDESS